MGLGIRIGAKIGAGRNPREEAAPGELFRSIAASLPGLIGHPLHARLAMVSASAEGVDARLHPAEEAVEFRIGGNGLLVVSAKTSSAGPGYHAFLVELLDRIGEACALRWIWADEEEEFLDETGYAGSRDFPSLQREMVHFLRRLSGLLIEKDEGLNYALSMPLGFGLAGRHFAISSMGFWERSWFQSAARASEEVAFRHGADFFPWWGEGRDAAFWLRCGLVKSWVDIPWHPPAGDGEREEYRTTLECFRLAKRMDAAIPLPDREIAEMEALLSKTGGTAPPAQDRIGFRRRPMQKGLTGGWSIVIPGYFYESTEEDGSTVVFWHGDRTVRGSSLEATRSPGAAARPWSHEGGLRFEDGHLTGSADIGKAEEEGHTFWMLEGVVSMEIGETKIAVCVVTICYEDPEDRDWAVETWKSAYRAPEAERGSLTRTPM